MIPYLIERNSFIWNRALSELTDEVLEDPTIYSSKNRTEYWKKWAEEKL